MSWILLGKTPKPTPDGKNGDKTPADKTPVDPGPATNSDGLLGTLGGFLWDHKIAIPILLIAALIGIQYLWIQFRRKQAARGVGVRPLGKIVRDVTKFALKEDKRPIHAKIPPLTGTRLYLLLTVLTVASVAPGIPGLPPLSPLPLLIAFLAARYSKIAKARKSIVAQMFAVANGECRYPKGAELNPWGYVNVTSWANLIQPGQTVVSIPAAYQSEDMKTREKFERNFNGTVSEENAWTYKWESAKNRIVCEPAAFLPSMASYPGPGEKWDEIPVGIGTDGNLVHIPLTTTPHVLVCGPTGSGKSVLQRNILFHALAHADTWRIVAIDMKKVEMNWLKKYPTVLKVATDLEEAVEVLRSLRAEMMRRYEEMEAEGVNHAKDLPDPPKAIMCMIDESTVLLAPEGIKSDEGKERDELHAECGMIIGELGRLSRASMIHVIACFQRPDAAFLKGETKANFDCRVAAGRMDTTPSLMVLDSEAANRLPKIKGRGMIRVGGELDTFQGFFAEQSWFDQWVADQEAARAGVTPDAAAPSGVPDGSGEGGRKRRVPKPGKSGGLKGLAAKAAAKAEARAARMDAEAEGSGDVDDDVPVSPVEGVELPVASDLGPDVDDVDDEYDDGYDDEDASDDEPEVAVEVEPVYVPEPRPTIPQPVTAAPPAYQPGAPLPDWLQPPAPPEPPAAPVDPPEAVPVIPVRPAGGLPTQPPRGLPTRPPSSG